MYIALLLVFFIGRGFLEAAVTPDPSTSTVTTDSVITAPAPSADPAIASAVVPETPLPVTPVTDSTTSDSPAPIVTPPIEATSSAVVSSPSYIPAPTLTPAEQASNEKEKTMLAEVTTTVVVSEAVNVLYKEAENKVRVITVLLADLNKTSDELRATHRSIDQSLDMFYEEVGGLIGKLTAQADRLKVHFDKKLAKFQKASYEVANAAITQLNTFPVRIDEYRGLVEKVKGAQKEIDVTDDQIREKIKKLDDLFTEASNSFRDAGTARTNILSALDEASARGLVSQINTIAAALEQKKNDFKGGITKEITDLTTKITDQMKSVKEQAKALEEKATNMHKELDGIQLPLKGSAASLQPSSDNAKGVVASSAVIAQADVKQTTSVVVRKKIKIEEKSSIRLSIESIISAFSDMYEIVKEKVLGIWAVFFGKTQKEDAPISTEIKVKKVLADQTVSDSEKKQYIEFMKQERISQLERLKRIDADLKDQGIELKTP